MRSWVLLLGLGVVGCTAARAPITPEAITREVSSRTADGILACAKKNRADLPKDRCVSYKLRILPTGEVAEVAILSKKVGKRFASCLRKTLAPLRFAAYEIPAPSYEFAQVLNFSGTDRGCRAPPEI